MSKYCLTTVCLVLVASIIFLIEVKIFLYSKVSVVLSLIFSMHSKCDWSFEVANKNTIQVENKF